MFRRILTLSVATSVAFVTVPRLTTNHHALTAQSAMTATCTSTADTRLEQKAPTTNYGSWGTLWAAGDVNRLGQLAEAAMKFDCSSIPAGATILSASLNFYVSHSTTNTYELYELTKAWTESGATWEQASPTEAWQVAGARGSSDRDSRRLGVFTSASAGPKSVPLNADGIQLVSGWVNGATNNGVLLRPPLGHDDVGFASRETGNGAVLEVTSSTGTVYPLPLIADARLEEKAPTSNYASHTTLYGAGNVNGVGHFAEAALRFDPFLIPAGTVLQSATLKIYVTFPTVDTYEIFELKKSWTETGTTWNNYSSGGFWEVPGAKGSSDRGNTVLGSLPGAATGQQAIPLSAEAVTLISGWANGTIPNNGLLLRSPLSGDDVGFNSREGATAPTLEVTYTTSSSSAVQFRFMTYNIAHGCDRADRTTSTIPLIADYIRQSGASVISLNEVEINDSNWCSQDQAALLESELESRMPGRDWQRYMSFTDSNSGNLLLWLADTPSAVPAGFPNASGTTTYKLSSNRYPRAIGVVRLPINGQTATFMSTHLDNGGTSADSDMRYQEVGELLQFDDAYDDPVIVGGDFNGQPGSPEIGRMVGDYFDAWAEAVANGTEAPAGYSGITSDWGTRIDYVFFRRPPSGSQLPLVLVGTEVADPRKPDGSRLSDHRPVIATFRIE